MTAIRSIQSALAEKAPQPQTAFDALCALCDTTFGLKLCTFTTVEPVTHEGVRIYTNMPEAYPVSGRKPRADTYWSSWVIDDQKTFVANDIAAISEVFFDHELINSLGCASVINLPIVVAGQTIGTINCLDEAGHFTPERVAAAEELRLAGTACFLLAQAVQNGAL